MSRIRRTLFAVFCGRGLMAVRQLLLIPILLKSWGVEYYGHWLVLTAIPTFLAMSNLGLGTSASAKLALRSPGSDQMESARIVATAWSLISGIFLCLVTGLYLWNLFSPDTFGSLDHGLQILILLLTAQFVRMLSQPVQGWWNSIGKASKSLHFNNAFSAGELIVYASVPLVGGKGALLALGVACWSVIWLAIYLTRSHLAGCRLFFKAPPSRAEAKSLLGSGIGHQMSPLWQALLFQGTIFLASHLFGATGAALWGSMRTLVRAGNQLLELVSQSVGPEFQHHHAKGEINENRALHNRSVLLSVTLATGMAGGVVVLGPWVFDHWTHHAFVIPTQMWWIMGLGLIPFSLWWVSGEYQRSLNQPWYLNILGCIAAVGSLVVIWSLARIAGLGIISLSLGTLFFETVMAGWVSRRTMQMMGLDWSDAVKGLRQEFRMISRPISGMLKRGL